MLATHPDTKVNTGVHLEAVCRCICCICILQYVNFHGAFVVYGILAWKVYIVCGDSVRYGPSF
jgi:hypothetical protein